MRALFCVHITILITLASWVSLSVEFETVLHEEPICQRSGGARNCYARQLINATRYTTIDVATNDSIRYTRYGLGQYRQWIVCRRTAARNAL